MHIPVRIRCTNALNCLKHFSSKLLLQGVLSVVLVFVILEEIFICKSPWHVDFNLMTSRRRVVFVDKTNQGWIVCPFLLVRRIQKSLSTSDL